MIIGKKELAKYIDHTMLKPNATGEDIARLCDEAAEYGFAGACVNPSYIGFAATRLRGSRVTPCCVIGFPFGATLPEAKAYEASAAIVLGAKEVDMVMNISAAKSGAWALVEKDIREVVETARGRALVKVIIETCLLTDPEKVKACSVAESAGADFVKTSTGFSTGGATAEDVRLLRRSVDAGMGVKASGGIRDYDTAIAMIEAGATRLGTSSGIKILEGAR